MAVFQKWHSSNTVLLKIRDNILGAMPKRKLVLSVYSDYSKAFESVQHHTIIQKLHKIGLSTAALKWFISYLGQRSQYVQVNDSKSTTKPCNFGAVQGSVLGQLLRNLYVKDLQYISPADLVNACQYTDDATQFEHFQISKILQTLKSENTQNRLNNLNFWS